MNAKGVMGMFLIVMGLVICGAVGLVVAAEVSVE
ncbi:hypothetical protein G3A_20825 [Bacillus sp. 17376]|nr:hypothetical protein G3A_20825 [Bacillus sp. 17376]